MLPPTRTGAVGGGGGGGASGRPPTTPPMTPPGTPPSTPPGTPVPTLGTETSGLISLGASTGAAFGLVTTGSTFGCATAGAGGGGGGGGGGGADATNAIIDGGVGSTSVAISGMMITAANSATWAMMDRGTVY